MKTVIESLDCPNCGAPLDVKPGQDITICLYCDSSVRIRMSDDETEKTAPKTEILPEIMNKIKQLILDGKKDEAIELYTNEANVSKEAAIKAVKDIYKQITTRIILDRPLSGKGFLLTGFIILLLLLTFYIGIFSDSVPHILKIFTWIIFAFSAITLLSVIRTFITTIKFFSLKWTDAKVLKFAQIGEDKHIIIFRILMEVQPQNEGYFQAQTNMPVRKNHLNIIQNGIMLKVKYLKDKSSVIASMAHLIRK